MSTSGSTRREFVVRSVTGAAALGASSLAGRAAPGANDRIQIGVIGCGGRGTHLTQEIANLQAQHNVRVTAVCDVWDVNLEKAVANVQDKFSDKPRAFTRFGDLLALDEVDAVVIATPDFAHTPIMIEALKANKDVYVEKPMALKLENAREALRLARARSRVVQVGTQRRSDGKYLSAGATIQKGPLGHISKVTASVNVNHARWLRDPSDCKKDDVDWDAYLFNVEEKVPFNPSLLRRWHLFKMCTNGLSGLWMSHFADAINILLGTTYPTTAVAHGGTYVWKEEREHCDTFHALIEYPEELLFSWSMNLANGYGGEFLIKGRDGTFDVEKMKFLPSGGPKDKEIVNTPIEKVEGDSHMGNWLTCLRTRKRPNADIEYGLQHTVATIMTADALHTGARQRYDAEAGRIVPDVR